ncbi:MAG: J domain-containing protein [Pirellulales bacterium]
MAEDYYKTLGVARDASQADIDKAYSTLARKFHPDVNPDDKTAKKKFQAVQAAYDVLKDPIKRELYDRYGSSFESAAGGARGGPGAGAGRGRGAAPGFEDFDFSQFFGERYGGDPGDAGFADIFSQFRRARSGPRRGRAGGAPGADLAYELEIPFNMAVSGGEAQLAVPRAGGKRDTLAVKIPPGIDDGKKIRLRGQGQPGNDGGPAGDILITIRVGAHPHFSRRGDDLHVKVPVTLAEAALGAKVDVPTPNGTVSLRVPPGTSSGKRLRIKGHGVAAKGRDAGDLLAEIQIVLPSSLDEQSLESIRQIESRHPLNPRRDLRW